MENNNFTIDKTFTLAIKYHQEGNLKDAEKIYKKILKTDPKHSKSLNNLGVIFYKVKKFEEAKNYYEKALMVNPNFAEAHNNLGVPLLKLGEYKKSITSFKKAIEIKPNFEDAYNNLGTTYKELKEFEKAANYFEKVNSASAKGELLECTYFSNNLEKYSKILNKFIKTESCNIRIAAIAEYVARKENIKNIYPFCKNPLNFVVINNLKNKYKSPEDFLNNLLKVLKKTEATWEPLGKTTKHGYQTLATLFDNFDSEIITLKELIENQINIYKENLKENKDHFILKWPIKNKIQGWYLRLIKKGHQAAHIHQGAWISGVFYLKIPKLLNNNEGSIKFSLIGYDYPYEKNLPNLIYSPKDFDLVLFPSSLFHETIPFNSQDERHSIAFDLVPI